MEKQSKYFRKHYYIAKLTDVQCRSCGKYFAVDLDACDAEPDEFTPRYWAVFHCPYCSKKIRQFM